MRTLKFIVDDQIITQDPSCDFENLVPGTEQYIKAVFSFSKEWDGCVKVAQFKSIMGTEFPPKVLEDGVSCVIPAEALSRKRFQLSVLGKDQHGKKLTTSKVTVTQKGNDI